MGERIKLSFTMLLFDVQQLIRGRGEQPDSIAHAFPHHPLG